MNNISNNLYTENNENIENSETNNNNIIMKIYEKYLNLFRNKNLGNITLIFFGLLLIITKLKQSILLLFLIILYIIYKNNFSSPSQFLNYFKNLIIKYISNNKNNDLDIDEFTDFNNKLNSINNLYNSDNFKDLNSSNINKIYNSMEKNINNNINNNNINYNNNNNNKSFSNNVTNITDNNNISRTNINENIIISRNEKSNLVTDLNNLLDNTKLISLNTYINYTSNISFLSKYKNNLNVLDDDLNKNYLLFITNINDNKKTNHIITDILESQNKILLYIDEIMNTIINIFNDDKLYLNNINLNNINNINNVNLTNNNNNLSLSLNKLYNIEKKDNVVLDSITINNIANKINEIKNKLNSNFRNINIKISKIKNTNYIINFSEQNKYIKNENISNINTEGILPSNFYKNK